VGWGDLQHPAPVTYATELDHLTFVESSQSVRTLPLSSKRFIRNFFTNWFQNCTVLFIIFLCLQMAATANGFRKFGQTNLFSSCAQKHVLFFSTFWTATTLSCLRSSALLAIKDFAISRSKLDDSGKLAMEKKLWNNYQIQKADYRHRRVSLT